MVSLVDEGLDVTVRQGRLPDSAPRAIRAGEVRRGVYASSAYFRAHGTPRTPQALASHACVACTPVTPVPDRWTFSREGRSVVVQVSSRLVVNTARSWTRASRRSAVTLGPSAE